MRAACVLLATAALGACGDDARDPADLADTVPVPETTDLSDATEATDLDPIDVIDPTDATDAVGPGEIATWDRARDPWPMFGGDPQRTGRSPFVGPATYTPEASENWVYAAEGGASINMQPTLAGDAIHFGTWGLLRGAATTDPASSRKSDGKVYALDAAGREVFAPFDPRPLPACYAWDEPVSPQDEAWCGQGADLHVTFYNGTIEGSALVDPWNGRHYVGRGDGRLYAIDVARGEVVWDFVTFDPLAPEHPDGGGEIVQGATMGPDGTIYFASFGVPWPGDASAPARETQAIYAVDREGALVWRYPSEAPSLDNTLTAAVALSPDGRTLYAGTWLSDPSAGGKLIALDLGAPREAADAARRKWELPLVNEARALRPKVWTRHLSVGGDGTIYVGGAEAKVLGYVPAVVAVQDRGDRAEVAWIAEPEGYPESATTLVQGLALGDGVVFATTGDVRNLNGREGSLFAIDMASGETLGRFSPGEDAPGSATGPLVDAAGVVYFGARGRHDLIAEPWSGQWRRGTLFAVAWDADERRFTERWRRVIDALLDWATPAIDQRGVLYVGSTAPLPTRGLEQIWEPLEGTPPRTTPYLFATAR